MDRSDDIAIPGPRVYIETYGCQMNVYDSELLASVLRENGFRSSETLEAADVALLNTCAVRESAQEKIWQRLHAFAQLKVRGRLRAIGLLGCMAQSLRRTVAKRAPDVDVVAGPDTYRRLPLMLRSVLATSEPAYDFALSRTETYSGIAPLRASPFNAWIAIMRGCDNMCSFCLVPFTRGRERSRNPDNIIEEARVAVERGIPQVTLLGQNVNSYRLGETDFAGLVDRLAGLPGLRRLRFTSPHPKDFPRHLLEVMAHHENVCKHIHLPLQAGSDRVLERMNRTYTGDEFLRLVDTIRETLPGVGLTTDVICGFCGETDGDFRQTVEIMERVRFDSAFIFKYSQRPHTLAARRLKDDIPDAVKTERVVILNELQRHISQERNIMEIEKTYDVLVEEPSHKDPSHWLGRTDHGKGVVFSAPDAAPGDFVNVRVNDAGTNTLIGGLPEARDPILTEPTSVVLGIS